MSPSTQTVDLRNRRPDPDKCLPHPCDCSQCAWGFVTPDDPNYQPGSNPEAADITVFLPGAYQGNCGVVRPVQLANGEVGAIRRGRYYSARTDQPAFQAYRSTLGL